MLSPNGSDISTGPCVRPTWQLHFSGGAICSCRVAGLWWCFERHNYALVIHDSCVKVITINNDRKCNHNTEYYMVA